MADIRPPIPMRLVNRPTTSGLVAPWVNIVLADGGVDFRQTKGTNWREAWTKGLCQVDGQPLGSPVVFLGGPNQIAEGGFFDEPPLHPECAAYAMKACPMISGRMSHYRAAPSVTEGHRGEVCPEPGCGCGGFVASEQVLDGKGGVTVRPSDEHRSSAGEPAHAWYAVYARTYRIALDSGGRLLGGVPTNVVRIRELNVSEQSGTTRNDLEQHGTVPDAPGWERTPMTEPRRGQIWRPVAVARANRRILLVDVNEQGVVGLSSPNQGPGHTRSVRIPRDRLGAHYVLVEEAPNG